MHSIKKPLNKKRAPLPLKSGHTREFEKDWIKLDHSGKHDLKRLREVMLLLIANDGPLSAEWEDHPLTGEWRDHRECHAKGDLLLIYRLTTDGILFVRAGTHSELFGK